MEAVFNSFKIANIHYSVNKKMKGEKGKHGCLQCTHTLTGIFPFKQLHCVG